MKTLEHIVDETKRCKDLDTSSVIVKRYGCNTVSSKMRGNKIYGTDKGFDTFYITDRFVRDNFVARYGGSLVYRNAPLAVKLLQSSVGDDYSFFIKRAPNQIYSTQNNGHILNEVNLLDNYVHIEGEGIRTFKSLSQFLSQLQRTSAEREANVRRQRELEEERIRAEEEARSAQEKKRLTEEINKLKLANQKLEGQIEE